MPVACSMLFSRVQQHQISYSVCSREKQIAKQVSLFVSKTKGRFCRVGDRYSPRFANSKTTACRIVKRCISWGGRGSIDVNEQTDGVLCLARHSSDEDLHPCRIYLSSLKNVEAESRKEVDREGGQVRPDCAAVEHVWPTARVCAACLVKAAR